MEAALDVRCPRCGASNTILTEGEPTLVHAFLSFSEDFFHMGLFSLGGFTGHEPAQVQCRKYGSDFTVDLNWRLRTYTGLAPVYMLIHFAMVAAAVAVLLLSL